MAPLIGETVMYNSGERHSGLPDMPARPSNIGSSFPGQLHPAEGATIVFCGLCLINAALRCPASKAYN